MRKDIPTGSISEPMFTHVGLQLHEIIHFDHFALLMLAGPCLPQDARVLWRSMIDNEWALGVQLYTSDGWFASVLVCLDVIGVRTSIYIPSMLLVDDHLLGATKILIFLGIAATTRSGW